MGMYMDIIYYDWELKNYNNYWFDVKLEFVSIVDRGCLRLETTSRVSVGVKWLI